MLDKFDRRAEQEGVAIRNLNKFQINVGTHKPVLYNNATRANAIPATVIKQKKTKTYIPEHSCKTRKSDIPVKKELPVFKI